VLDKVAWNVVQSVHWAGDDEPSVNPSEYVMPAVHTPLLHVGVPPVQRVPQPPQLFESESLSEHDPLHTWLAPAGQQVLCMQLFDEQTAPQAPQLALSDVVSAHVLGGQNVLSGAWQLATHVPPAQSVSWPTLHLWPQLPQLLTSVLVFAQNGAPPSGKHAVVADPVHVELHAPTPASSPQVVSGPHTLPQPPQLLFCESGSAQ
jgi:hypothetical protein